MPPLTKTATKTVSTSVTEPVTEPALPAPTTVPTDPSALGLGLGLDAGGTQTRWALCSADGVLRHEGTAAALTGLQLVSSDGQAHVAAVLAGIASAVAAAGAAPLRAVTAGVTGFDSTHAPLLQQLAASAFGVPQAAVQTLTDIELTCRAAFAPGGGIVVYAGTGAIAALLDADGTLHRAGGRGAVIDDAGGGHWIASQALRRVWRAEDAAPGAWRTSVLAQLVFAVVGGSDWAASRAWVYGPAASRGAIGTLALAVADAARQGDADALQILHDAGCELARLARALQGRVGPRPLALAGRVFDLHPALEAGLRAALADSAAPLGPMPTITRITQSPHHAAALLAAHRTLPP